MNLPTQTTHLSEEALDAVLLGQASADDMRHLVACEPCSGRVAEFRTSLATFNQASAAWSVARSNTISRELTPSKSSHSTAAAWSLACVTILAVAFSLTGPLRRSLDFSAFEGREAQPALQQSSNGQQPNQQQEIANDNAMLVAIDSELSQPVQSPVAAYRNGGAAAPKSVGREVRD